MNDDIPDPIKQNPPRHPQDRIEKLALFGSVMHICHCVFRHSVSFSLPLRTQVGFLHTHHAPFLAPTTQQQQMLKQKTKSKCIMVALSICGFTWPYEMDHALFKKENTPLTFFTYKGEGGDVILGSLFFCFFSWTSSNVPCSGGSCDVGVHRRGYRGGGDVLSTPPNSPPPPYDDEHLLSSIDVARGVPSSPPSILEGLLEYLCVTNDVFFLLLL